MKTIPIQVKRKCVEMAKQGLNSREIYNQYYSKIQSTSYDSFRTLLKRWKKKTFADDGLLESANLGYKFIPHDSTVQVNGSGEIIQAWIKQKAEEENTIEQVLEAIKKNTPHEKITPNKKAEASGMLEINLCDLHFGIADLEYYRPTLEEILLIITKQHYEEINVMLGQDQFHNDNFKGITTKGTLIQKVDIEKAWNDAKTFWYNVIDTACEYSNKVKLIYIPGNHDYCLSWTFMQMLKERYQDLEIDDSLGKRKCVTYGDNFIGLTHGEFKKSKPSDLRSQFSVKFPMEFARSKVKEIHCSHLHTEWEKDEYGVMIRRLSTGNKDDSWSDDEGYIGANKRFMIFEWLLDKLKSIHYV